MEYVLIKQFKIICSQENNLTQYIFLIAMENKYFNNLFSGLIRQI